MNPFDFVKSINDKTGNLIDRDPNTEREYSPYIVNRALSQFADTVMAANTMNSMHYLDKKLQYDYLYRSVKKSKRFARWIKPEREEDWENMIMEWYKVSRVRAREYLSMMTEQDKEELTAKTYIGGTKKP